MYKRIETKLDYCLSIDDKDYSSELFITTENEALEGINTIRESARVKRPKGVALSKQLSEDYELYLEKLQVLEKNISSK